jgi:tetratricopeptide (TPR) repeat protein
MVKTDGKHSKSLLTTKSDKLVVIEEKPTKPPGVPKFHRKSPGTPIQTNQNEIITDKGSPATMCQQLLIQGYVQSYVDFYHLTHRVDPESHEETASMINISFDDLVFIRDSLTRAELARRQGDTSTVYTSYNKLADYYVTRKDWKTGFFFHEKCLEVSQLTSDIRAEMAANHSLGVINQLMNNYERARVHHERHEQLAVSVDVFEEVARANTELYKVYLVLAEKSDASGYIEDALSLFTLCLEAAKKSWDKSAEAEANGRIGNLLLQRGDLQQCIPYLKNQSQLAADLGHAESRCRACSALALAWDKLNQPEKALNELTLVHAISEQAGDAFLQAQACRALGTLYSKIGRLDSAVDILQRHFSLLKSILFRSQNQHNKNDPKAAKEDPSKKITTSDLDLARAYIGISKGNQLIGTYAIAIQYDFTALLDWKLNRTDLSKVSKQNMRASMESEGMFFNNNNEVNKSVDENESLAESMS